MKLNPGGSGSEGLAEVEAEGPDGIDGGSVVGDSTDGAVEPGREVDGDVDGDVDGAARDGWS